MEINENGSTPDIVDSRGRLRENRWSHRIKKWKRDRRPRTTKKRATVNGLA
ncbi:MAG: hypothetical protein AAF591_10895 [Verrucomicrobiota bacterium]